jgi:hypothetical protein
VRAATLLGAVKDEHHPVRCRVETVVAMSARSSAQRGEEAAEATARQMALTLIDARFEGVIFDYLGDVAIQPRGGAPAPGKATKSGTGQGILRVRPQAFRVYGALIDRHLTTRSLALAMCSGPIGAPATTLDALTWSQLHLRTYSDEELDELFPQLHLDWQRLRVAQELAPNPYDGLDDVDIRQLPTKKADKAKSTANYRALDGTFSLTTRAHRAEARGMEGNDLPLETTLAPVIELFDTMIVLE